MSLADAAVETSRERGGAWRIETRELYLWFAVSLFLGVNLKAAHVLTVGAFDVNAIRSFSVFHLLAWGVVLRLLIMGASRAPASRLHFLCLAGLGVLNLFPSPYLSWAAVGLFAALIFFSAPRLSPARSAAVVLWALFAQAVIGPAVFSALAFYFLRADAALVGAALEATRSGYSWHDNLVQTAGYGIEIVNGCSSFHNVSLAFLCWVTLTKWRRDRWIASDFLVAGLACLAMIAMNAARLYAIALGPDEFVYWHDGNGAEIFALAATAVIVAISQYGASLGASERG